jgi:hypothetical protein
MDIQGYSSNMLASACFCPVGVWLLWVHFLGS